MLEASEKIEEMKSAGAARVVAVVKEDIGTEVADFREKFWSGEVLMDPQKKFYVALGGGKENKTYSLMAFLAMIANPFSSSPIKAALSDAKKKGIDGNITGEGFINGGVYVIRQDGKAAYAYPEERMGDWVPVDEVVEGVKAAARGEVYAMAPVAMSGGSAEKTKKTWKEWSGRTDGPDGYVWGDIARGLKACRKKSKESSA